MVASFLTARNLSQHGFRHAFFTRRGGHSPPPFDSLHFGALGHSPGELAANVREAAFGLGIEPARLYTTTQVHGTDVLLLSGTEDTQVVRQRTADALLTKAAGVACAVKVADCVPVLLADVRSGAVAAIHSGWQGAAANVAGVAAAALQGDVGGESTLVAAIGPHIRACCFEVGDDVAAALARAAGVGHEATVVSRVRGRAHVDLAAIVTLQLRAAGLASAAIEVLDVCAKCDAARFFSYRRDRELSGRNLAAIVAQRASDSLTA